MLKFGCRIFNNSRVFHRQLSQNALKNGSLDPSKILLTNLVNEINIDFPKLQITSPQYYPKKEIRDIPLIQKIIENPTDSLLNEIRDIIRDDPNKIIETPTHTSIGIKDEIQAARLIVIRRRKMRIHKLRKLRKKMKFEWAKVRQRREMRKEKLFQAGLLFRIKKAEAFSAEQYVTEKLRQANETPIPRFWKGRRLPQFIIKEKLGIK